MSHNHSTDLMGALPRTRPHRRSDKRPARGAATAPPKQTTAATAPPKQTTAKVAPRKETTAGAATRRQVRRLPQPPQPEGTPTRAPAGPVRRPARPAPVPVLTTAVQAVGELAEIGLSLGTRALRGAIGRLPRP
jgi:hypothetical protein